MSFFYHISDWRISEYKDVSKLSLSKKGDDKFYDYVEKDTAITNPSFQERNLDRQCGTKPYMSPEVLLRPYSAEPADIWSCGIVLVALLAGGELTLLVQSIFAYGYKFFSIDLCVLVPSKDVILPCHFCSFVNLFNREIECFLFIVLGNVFFIGLNQGIVNDTAVWQE